MRRVQGWRCRRILPGLRLIVCVFGFPVVDGFWVVPLGLGETALDVLPV